MFARGYLISPPEVRAFVMPVTSRVVCGLEGPTRLPKGFAAATAIKALRAVETVLPLLGDDPRFDAIRREVGAVRRWIETGVDGRHVLNVFRDSFEPPGSGQVCP